LQRAGDARDDRRHTGGTSDRPLEDDDPMKAETLEESQQVRADGADLSTSLHSRQQAIGRVIESRWRQYYPAVGTGSVPDVAPSGPARVKRYSVLFEYTITFAPPHPPVSIVAKIHRTSHGDRANQEAIVEDAGRRDAEWAGLCRAYGHFAGRADGLGVVRPVDHLERYQAILVEKASGRDLGDIIKAGGPEGAAALERAGIWLAAFHRELHRETLREWTAHGYATALERRRSALLGLGVSPQVVDPLLDRVLATARWHSPAMVPCSVLHGDYKLKHIWATPGGIEVLDFGNTHEGDCYVDVAALLVESITWRLGRPWIGRRRLERHTRPFLHAYFGGDPPPVFWLYVVESLLKKWSRRLVRWSGGNSTPWAVAVQQHVQRARAMTVTSHVYLNRWFAGQIREALDRAGSAGR
jgi:hypothetical protein